MNVFVLARSQRSKWPNETKSKTPELDESIQKTKGGRLEKGSCEYYLCESKSGKEWKDIQTRDIVGSIEWWFPFN